VICDNIKGMTRKSRRGRWGNSGWVCIICM